jgi:hypothetical protein
MTVDVVIAKRLTTLEVLTGFFHTPHEQEKEEEGTSMRDYSDPEFIAKLLEASQVMNPHYIEFHEGAYYENRDGSYRYYGGFSLRIEGSGVPLPPMKVKVDSPKTVHAKKSKKRESRPRRIKAGTVFLKNGTILLKDREAGEGTT